MAIDYTEALPGDEDTVSDLLAGARWEGDRFSETELRTRIVDLLVAARCKMNAQMDEQLRQYEAVMLAAKGVVKHEQRRLACAANENAEHAAAYEVQKHIQNLSAVLEDTEIPVSNQPPENHWLAVEQAHTTLDEAKIVRTSARPGHKGRTLCLWERVALLKSERDIADWKLSKYEPKG